MSLWRGGVLGKGLWQGGLLRSPASRFHPLTLFANGEGGGWWDLSNTQHLWVDQARTQHPIDGDLVWWIDDQSGNGLHIGAADTNSRGTYRVSNGRPYLDLTSGHYYSSSARNGVANTYIIAAFRPPSGDFALRGTNDGAGILMMGAEGVDAPAFRDIAPSDTPPIRLDGASYSYANRDDIFTSMAARDNVVTIGPLEFVDQFEVVATRHFNWSNGNDYPLVRWYGEIEVERALTSAEISAAEAYLAARAGISL